MRLPRSGPALYIEVMSRLASQVSCTANFALALEAVMVIETSRQDLSGFDMSLSASSATC
jgi:hypothetical protein